MSNVLLFREPSSDSLDRYESTLGEAGLWAKCIPVLETLHTNLDTLVNMLKFGSNFNGVIITSKRACDSWKAALEIFVDSFSDHRMMVAQWCEVPFYVVGQGTGSALREIQEHFLENGFASIQIRGESSGTGEQLAQLILKETLRPGKLLYLIGDKNRDTISQILSEGNLDFQSVQVYETRGRSDFEGLLTSTINDFVKESTEDPHTRTWWIVYFAPSAAAFVTPFLEQHFSLGSTESTQSGSQRFGAKIGAIGPTTAKFLESDLGLTVSAMASKPSPDELRNAILAYGQ